MAPAAAPPSASTINNNLSCNSNLVQCLSGACKRVGASLVWRRLETLYNV